MHADEGNWKAFVGATNQQMTEIRTSELPFFNLKGDKMGDQGIDFFPPVEL